MNGDDFTKDKLLSQFLQLEQRVEELEQENKRKDENINQLQEQLDQNDERIEGHTPSKVREPTPTAEQATVGDSSVTDLTRRRGR